MVVTNVRAVLQHLGVLGLKSVQVFCRDLRKIQGSALEPSPKTCHFDRPAGVEKPLYFTAACITEEAYCAPDHTSRCVRQNAA